MPKTVDLNKLIVDTSRKTPSIIGHTKIMFDTTSILSALISRIGKSDTKFVMGCAAWFTNAKIIAALSKLRGVCIICTRDKVARTKTTKAKYRTLPKHDGIPPIKLLGAGRGRSASLMHHKYLVGMSADQQPLWVSTGSFNLTESACTNIENLMIIESPEIATVFLKEFQRLYPLSKALSLK